MSNYRLIRFKSFVAISHPTMQLVFFYLHLVLHACAARFDVTGTAQNFLESKQALILVALAVAELSVCQVISIVFSC